MALRYAACKLVKRNDWAARILSGFHTASSGGTLTDTLISTASPDFLAIVEDWFRRTPEIVILVPICHAAGCKDIEVMPTFEAFGARLARLQSRTAITVFRDHRLPLRGTIDDAFIQACIATIPDGTEYVVALSIPRTAEGRPGFIMNRARRTPNYASHLRSGAASQWWRVSTRLGSRTRTRSLPLTFRTPMASSDRERTDRTIYDSLEAEPSGAA